MLCQNGKKDKCGIGQNVTHNRKVENSPAYITNRMFFQAVPATSGYTSYLSLNIGKGDIVLQVIDNHRFRFFCSARYR